jgi:hypothetical protein
MADLLGGTTIGGYLALHAGILDSYLTQNGIRSGYLEIYNSTGSGNFTENLRLPLAPNSWTTIVLGCSPNTVGTGIGVWSIHRNTSGNFAICHNNSSGGFELTQAGGITWQGNTIWHAGNLGTWHKDATAPSGTTRLNYEGYLYATRVYNAYYNDYAEYFEKSEETEPGDIISLDPLTKKYIKSRTYADRLVRGVHSNEYGHCIGGDGKENVEERFIPIGLSGRNHVKILGKAKAGQYIITLGTIPGIGIATDTYFPGAIIGQCEEDKDTEDIGLIRIFIKYL